MESIGKYLQETREALGLSIEEASQNTRLKTYIIEQIENDDFTALGDVGFTKIMIITYSRFLQADLSKVQEKLTKMFDKPSEPPIKIDTVKNKKTVFIQPNTIYFILLGLLIVLLSFSVVKLYKDDSFSFDAFRVQLATTEIRSRTPIQQTEVEPDTLWVLQRQIFHEVNNLQIDGEIPEPIINRIGFFSRNTNREENVPIYIHSRTYLQDNTDYVGEFIFGNAITPLNPEIKPLPFYENETEEI